MHRLKVDFALPPIAWVVIATFAGLVYPTALLYPSLDSDVVWQRRLGESILHAHAIPRFLDGRSYAAPHVAWVPQEWLFSLGVAVATRTNHWAIFATFVVACAAAALAITGYRSAIRGAEPFAVALTTGIAAVELDTNFGVRAQCVAWLPFSTLLLLVELGGPFLWWCLPVVAIWANIHASVILAPLLLGIAAVCAFVEDNGFSRRARDRIVVAAGSVVAICCTPLGIALFPYALSLQNGFVREQITEWQPPLFDDPRIWFGILPIMVAVLTRGFGERRSLTDFGWFACFVVAALDAVRHIPLFMIAAAPMAAAALTAAKYRASDEAVKQKWSTATLARAAACCIVCVAVAYPIASAILPRLSPPADSVVPRAVRRQLALLGGDRRIFCGDFAWCSTLLDENNVLMLMDGRADPYPREVWDDQRDLGMLAPGWRTIIHRFRIDTMLVERSSPLAQALADTGRWRLVATEKKYMLWIRRS
jgi:hypothetical protein